MIYFRTSMIVSELFNVENELFLFIDLAELWNFDFSSCIEVAGVSIWKQRYVKSFVLRIYIVLVLYYTNNTPFKLYNNILNIDCSLIVYINFVEITILFILMILYSKRAWLAGKYSRRSKKSRIDWPKKWKTNRSWKTDTEKLLFGNTKIQEFAAELWI